MNREIAEKVIKILLTADGGCGSSPKFPVKRVAEVINYTPPLILAYLEVLP